jgi:multiple sugar transport system substrate-binding protein
MANWFGFAAYADTAPDSMVKGLVDVAPLPAGEDGRSVSLNVFWVLAMASGSPNKALAWAFMRHLATAPMDRLTTTEGAIGTRRSTWADPEVNAQIPYYHRLDWLHDHARQIPHHPRLAAIAHVVDAMLSQALSTDRASADLLAEAQRAVEEIVA